VAKCGRGIGVGKLQRVSKEKAWKKYKKIYTSIQGRKWEKNVRMFKNKIVEVDGTLYQTKQVQNSDTWKYIRNV
jgi:hypothetical protein